MGAPKARAERVSAEEPAGGREADPKRRRWFDLAPLFPNERLWLKKGYKKRLAIEKKCSKPLRLKLKIACG